MRAQRLSNGVSSNAKRWSGWGSARSRRDSAVFPLWIPVIASDVAEWLQTKGVQLLGLDLPSVDSIDAKVLANHHALARAGIWIIESLDLSAVSPGLYNFAAFPLKIAGGDGAPVRAILWRD